MSVLMADLELGVRRQESSVDAHGYRASSGWGRLAGPWPGRGRESGDVPVGQTGGRTWVLALDPQAWPLHPRDLVVEVGGARREWLVLSADLHTHTWDPVVDYVRVEAHLKDDGGTLP